MRFARPRLPASASAPVAIAVAGIALGLSLALPVSAREPGHPPPPLAGYEYVLGEGRLNPDRGPRTARGDARMRRIWTDEVPRRLQPGAETPHPAPRTRPGP